MSKVKLIAITAGVGILEGKSPQDIISYTARVSNPNNQENFDTAGKLLRYCISHGHWSPFEMANMTVEIVTSRAIAAQILRHRSFSFQEFSQRYAPATEICHYYGRRQDTKNRQNSINDLSDEDQEWFQHTQDLLDIQSRKWYDEALKRGIAKEQARFLLPLSTKTVLYMNGSIRSWIHYLMLRTDKSTQLEHREIAEEVKQIFIGLFPDISEALEWR